MSEKETAASGANSEAEETPPEGEGEGGEEGSAAARASSSKGGADAGPASEEPSAQGADEAPGGGPKNADDDDSGSEGLADGGEEDRGEEGDRGEEEDKDDAPSASDDLVPVLEWDPAEEVPFNALNLTIIGLGVAAMIAGFVLLEQVNSDASNWQGAWSPLLLLAGYGLVAVGILIERTPGGDEVDESREGESFG